MGNFLTALGFSITGVSVHFIIPAYEIGGPVILFNILIIMLSVTIGLYGIRLKTDDILDEAYRELEPISMQVEREIANYKQRLDLYKENFENELKNAEYFKKLYVGRKIKVKELNTRIWNLNRKIDGLSTKIK